MHRVQYLAFELIITAGATFGCLYSADLSVRMLLFLLITHVRSMMSCVHTYYIHRKQLKFYEQTIYHYMATDVEQPLQLYTSNRAQTNDIKL